jgi:glycosyltransferase involved in cell wall biosynthesis
MFQQNLLSGMQNAGLTPSEILSVRQVESFPRSRQLLFPKEQIELDNGMKAILLPFFNLSPFKQVIIGISTLLHLLSWGWRTRHSAHRIVYTYNLTVPPGVFTLIGARLIKARTFVSLNDINKPGQTVPNTFFNRLDYWLHQKLIPLFNGHIVVSDSIIDDFAPGRPYIRVEGGVTDDMIQKTNTADSLRKPIEKKFTIVSVGSLSEANGFNVLLKSFSLLKEENYELYIAGTGMLENVIRQAAALDPRIKYLGVLDQKKIFELYSKADVLVNMRLTKKIDTAYFFPSKMMEYLVSGRPVITTCTGHIEEEFADFVFLIKEETAEALVAQLKHVASLEEGARTKVGMRARTYMCTHKTWNAQGERVAKFIRNRLSD